MVKEKVLELFSLANKLIHGVLLGLSGMAKVVDHLEDEDVLLLVLSRMVYTLFNRLVLQLY